MSPALDNMEQLFAAAKSLPRELSLKEVELIFLNPAPLPPKRPWYGSYLKFFAMSSFLLVAVLTFTVSTATQSPTLTAFPVVVTAATSPSTGVAPTLSTITNQMEPASSTNTETSSSASAARLALNTAPSPSFAPAAAPKKNRSMNTPDEREKNSVTAPKPAKANTAASEKPPLSIDALPGSKSDPLKQQLEGTSTISVPPLSITLPARKTADASLTSKKMANPTKGEVDKKVSQEALLPVKWGLEQAGYMSDTLKICSRNDRTCTMELKLKGKFRMMLNPKMDAKNMILYARPEAIAAMIIKNGFRKMALRNTSKGQVIDVEINPTALVGFRIKGNVELIDHEE